MITKYIGNPAGLDEQLKSIPDDKSGVKIKMPPSVADITLAVARNMYANAPVIMEAEGDFAEPAAEIKKSNGVVIRIPTDLDGVALLLLKTGASSFESIITRLSGIADHEELDFDVGYSNGEHLCFEVKMTKKKDVDYGKPMDPENIAFIQLFDYDLV